MADAIPFSSAGPDSDQHGPGPTAPDSAASAGAVGDGDALMETAPPPQLPVADLIALLREYGELA